MTEYNIFCYAYAEEYNNEDSFQQKRYRAFNKEVGEKRYKELVSLIKDDILKDFKLDLQKYSWNEAWEKLPHDKIKRLQEIPEFDSKVFEAITEIDVDKVDDDKTEEAISLLKSKGYKIVKK